jgi:multicomponent Na+:H+ antiporter subunit E
VSRVSFNPNLDGTWFGGVMELISMITMISIILTGAALIREREHGTIEHLMVMPLTPVEIALSKVLATMRRDLDVEEAPVDRPRRQTVLGRTGTARKYVAIFGASFLFYQALGAWTTFDLVTGGLTAGLVAALLAPIVFGRQPSLTRVAVQTVRLAVYAPYLLWEIAKANLQIAYVVLHPSLPIDPEMVEFEAAVWGDTPVTTLANSITLTPGTLTVSVTDRAFTIHSLTAGSRADLFDGGLERAVRFVFYGRDAMSIASPRERGDDGGHSDG